ncbi:hypothetical protein AMTRI_Chr01g131070 [Amborella trichopoda]
MRESALLKKSASSQPVQLAWNVTCWGATLLIFGCVSFLGFIYTAILSKLHPLSGKQFISAIQTDSVVGHIFKVLLLSIILHWIWKEPTDPFFCIAWRPLHQHFSGRLSQTHLAP